jgi:phage terminase large subunit-like protein
MAGPPMRNRAKHATGTEQPWKAWRGTRAGRYIKFVETQLVVPKGNGAKKAMKLHPYQREMFELWLDPSTRAGMVKIGRGNAKTTTLGAFITAHLFLEEDADVPVVATKVMQALKTTYGAVNSFIRLAPPLSALTVPYTAFGAARLEVPANNSVVYPMADKEDGLQGLDPSIAVLDEAAFATQPTWDALLLSAGKRPESKCIGIGTPSFDPENAMLNVETAWRSGKVLPGFVFREHTAPEGCDTADESVWPLANPGLVTKPAILAIDALRTSLAISPEQAFRCYRLAQWPTAAAGGWLGDGGSELWDRLEDPYDFVVGTPTWAAVDMSQRSDCSAVVSAQIRDDGRLHVKAKVWYPPEGGTVDPLAVMEHIRQLYRDHDLKGIYYDPRFFDVAGVMLRNEGIPAIVFPQSLERMTPAVMGCHESISRAELSHDGDDVFRRHVMNAQPAYSERGFTLSKAKSAKATAGKIDAAVALCMVHRMAVAPQDEWAPLASWA